jgi:calcineurin-like phosphoesterase family protein
MIWYSSDLHYKHPFLAKKRGFTKLDDRNVIGTPDGEPDVIGDADAHDAAVMGNWNKLVKPGDRAYILGDFAMNWKDADELLAQMNGEIILVCGNHDIMSAIHRDGWKHRAEWTGKGKFAAILDFAKRKVAGREFLMSHYPYTGDHGPERYLQYRLRDYGEWLLHGHTHAANRLGDITYSRMRGKSYETGEDETTEWMARNRQIHVGLDAWDLRPVSERQVTELMDEEETRAKADLDRWGE